MQNIFYIAKVLCPEAFQRVCALGTMLIAFQLSQDVRLLFVHVHFSEVSQNVCFDKITSCCHTAFQLIFLLFSLA